MKTKRSKNVVINSATNQMFRDIADQDYIAARACYRNGLSIQFLWFSLQAIEKYLKAILLYNGQSSRKIGHNLLSALEKIDSQVKFCTDFSNQALDFITYLNGQGANRYLEKNHYVLGNELLELDRTVWEIRRYCKVINYEKIIKGKKINMMEYELNNIYQWFERNDKHKFRLIGGHLEKVINAKNHSQRKALIWCNFYYGLQKKNSVRIPTPFKFINTYPNLYPDEYEVLKSVMKLG